MTLSKRSHEGWLMIDHRAAPGIDKETLKAAGVDAPAVPEGGVYECPTLGCNHCGGAVILNPKRTRPRAYCPSCDRYICDLCEAATRHPDYVHRTFDQIADMVMSGRYVVSGPTTNPILLKA